MGVLGEIGIRSDPVLSHNFIISLLDSSSEMAIIKSAALSAVMDIALGGFTEASGLEMTLDIEEYNEGGRNSHTLKFPSRVKWPNITLKKGVGAGNVLWDWHYSFVEGKGKRRDGVIILQTDLRVPHNIWYFRRGLPAKYTGPTLNAKDSSVAIESIEIAHEGIYQVPYVSAGATATTTVAGAVI